MRAALFVFSGTGNTMRVCTRLAEELRARGHETELYPIRAESSYPDPRAYDVVIVGFPVHAFNAPEPVLKFLKTFPAADKKAPRPVYLVRTSGEPLKMNDASAITPRRILKHRGYCVLGEYRYVMPYNIIFRHSDGMAARMWRAAESGLPVAAEEIAEGGGRREGVNVFKRMFTFVLRIEHTAMPILGHRFKATDKCIGCGACAKVCPQGNIEMVDGRPKFKRSCAGCMGCAFSCPEDALKISLLNGWRVNGKYTFEGEPAADSEVQRYCRKSYIRYFHRAEGDESGGKAEKKKKAKK